MQMARFYFQCCLWRGSIRCAVTFSAWPRGPSLLKLAPTGTAKCESSYLPVVFLNLIILKKVVPKSFLTCLLLNMRQFRRSSISSAAPSPCF